MPEPLTMAQRLNAALTLQPYLDPMQPINMAEGLWNMAKSGFTAPHDAYTGQLDPLSDQGVKRSMDLALSAPVAGLAVAPEKAALGAGVRGKPPASLGDILSEQLTKSTLREKISPDVPATNLLNAMGGNYDKAIEMATRRGGMDETVKLLREWKASGKAPPKGIDQAAEDARLAAEDAAQAKADASSGPMPTVGPTERVGAKALSTKRRRQQ